MWVMVIMLAIRAIFRGDIMENEEGMRSEIQVNFVWWCHSIEYQILIRHTQCSFMYSKVTLSQINCTCVSFAWLVVLKFRLVKYLWEY
jgi:hypothetical protein